MQHDREAKVSEGLHSRHTCNAYAHIVIGPRQPQGGEVESRIARQAHRQCTCCVAEAAVKPRRARWEDLHDKADCYHMWAACGLFCAAAGVYVEVGRARPQPITHMLLTLSL